MGVWDGARGGGLEPEKGDRDGGCSRGAGTLPKRLAHFVVCHRPSGPPEVELLASTSKGPQLGQSPTRLGPESRSPDSTACGPFFLATLSLQSGALSVRLSPATSS